jgi:NIMA (never in mitosis gene a)-related kinase
MIKGIKALHEKRILHRDLKSANIFTYSDGTVKIGDLNVSKIMKEQLSYTQTGTPYYASPEVWRDKPYDFKSDIWSLGVIIYEVAMLVVPFKAETIDDLYKKVCRGIYHPIPSTVFSIELSDLIKSMLNVDP